jgi:putative DNA primase/helicase
MLAETLAELKIFLDRGHKIFPCRATPNYPPPANGRPGRPKEPLVPAWCDSATSDPAIIDNWIANIRYSGCAWAVACSSSLWVLDVDGEEGATNLHILVAAHGDLPVCPTVRTGSGGWHYYFSNPDENISNSTGSLPAKLDVRGNRGYVIAPPSRLLDVPSHTDSYQWIEGRSLADVEPPPAPQWLLDLILANPVAPSHTPNAKSPTGLQRTLWTHPGADKGRRNYILCKLVGSALRKRVKPEHIIKAAAGFASRCKPPMSDDEWRTPTEFLINKHKNNGEVDGDDGPYTDGRFARTIIDADSVDGCSTWARGPDNALLRWTATTCWRPLAKESASLDLRPRLEQEFERRASIPLPNGKLRPPQEVTIQRCANLAHAITSAAPVAPERRPAWMVSRDDDPPAADVVGVKNGLLDLSSDTHRLLPPTPRFFSGAAIPVEYDPAATCPNWDAFLSASLPDADSRWLLQEWFGYLLSGRTNLHKFLYLFGEPRSGKSSITNIIKELFGGEATSLRQLSERFGLAPIQHASVVVIDEARFNPRLIDAQELKTKLLAITGGGAMSAEAKGKDATTADIRARLTMNSNPLLDLFEDSGALTLRMLIVHFRHSFAESPDIDLIDRLRGEFRGILNWSVAGLFRLRANNWRFTIGEYSKTALSKQRCRTQPVRSFVAEACEIVAGATVPRAVLRQAYADWADERSLPALTPDSFGLALSQACPSIQSKKIGSAGRREMHYAGLRLRPEYAPDADGSPY